METTEMEQHPLWPAFAAFANNLWWSFSRIPEPEFWKVEFAAYVAGAEHAGWRPPETDRKPVEGYRSLWVS